MGKGFLGALRIVAIITENFGFFDLPIVVVEFLLACFSAFTADIGSTTVGTADHLIGNLFPTAQDSALHRKQPGSDRQVWLINRSCLSGQGL
jgi:hypothetical protein